MLVGTGATFSHRASPMCYVNKCNFDRYYNGSRFMDGNFFLPLASMVRRNQPTDDGVASGNRVGWGRLSSFFPSGLVENSQM